MRGTTKDSGVRFGLKVSGPFGEDCKEVLGTVAHFPRWQTSRGLPFRLEPVIGEDSGGRPWIDRRVCRDEFVPRGAHVHKQHVCHRGGGSLSANVRELSLLPTCDFNSNSLALTESRCECIARLCRYSRCTRRGSSLTLGPWHRYGGRRARRGDVAKPLRHGVGAPMFRQAASCTIRSSVRDGFGAIGILKISRVE